MKPWTLVDGITIIRSMQADSMERNYYMALAGGVLNRGFSEKELDIVFVPRTSANREDELLDWLSDVFGGLAGRGEVPYGRVYGAFYQGRCIDIIVIGGS